MFNDVIPYTSINELTNIAMMNTPSINVKSASIADISRRVLDAAVALGKPYNIKIESIKGEVYDCDVIVTKDELLNYNFKLI